MDDRPRAARERGKAGEGEDGDKGYAKRELEGLVAEGGETVEPILDSFGSYSCDCVSLLYSPFVILFLMLYREETGLGEAYGIKEQDMRNYFNFAYVVIPFQFVADVFIHSSLELYHGWKIYDYLIYTRYRFLQRETRWKGMEDSLDECIDESVRTLDQMCFSDQYYMMITIQVNGMTMLVLGIQMMLKAEYNFIGDPSAITIIGMVFGIAYFIEWAIIKLALRFNLYRIKHENTAWHTQLAEDDEFDIPGWEDLQGASHDAYLMNQRITSETFPLQVPQLQPLVAHQPAALDPHAAHAAARSRPYLINQFTRILNQLNQDISSDSDDGDAKFGDVALTAPSRQIIRKWLADARRRMRLAEVVQPLISKARGTQCEVCLSRKQLQVEVVTPLAELADKYDAEHPDEEFDQVVWKTFWIKHQRYKHDLPAVHLQGQGGGAPRRDLGRGAALGRRRRRRRTTPTGGRSTSRPRAARSSSAGTSRRSSASSAAAASGASR